MPSNDKEPNELMVQNELKELVHDAISKLKPTYRVVVILRGINELSIKETAEILQYSESKVKVNYHRALKDLRRRINIDVREVVKNAN
ncbi:RNA polymerase sigma factor [Ornithinibacillus caprae]|uniref:RNA polymerase sigma factor n=1 Tax=Ornithinibacillus caprae TaxID=2678566 RepID=UPI00248357B7|nr:sigma-70 family RNA polymerase sigma factor [Ornithinibacillus caprae]